MQFPSLSWNTVQRWGLMLFVAAPLVLLALFLFVRSVVDIWKEYSPPEIVGGIFIAILIPAAVLVLESRTFNPRAFIGKRLFSSQSLMRLICFLTFFPVFSIYFLTGGEVRSVPATLEVGVIAVSVALGGLVLNAGLNRDAERGRDFIPVAQKFIAVVILMLIFLPTVHIVGMGGDIDVSSFEPVDPAAWVRGVTFWTAAASFYAGTGLFVIALVDLAYAVFGLGGTENASHRKRESPDRHDGCDGCEGTDPSP